MIKTTIDPFNNDRLRKNLEDTLVRNYLVKRVSLFEQIRKDLGVGENVGLGFYESDPFRFGWNYYSWARIDAVKVKNNKWYLKRFGIRSLLSFLLSFFIENKYINEYIVIPPSGSKKLYLVSFYPRQGVSENGRLEERLFKAPDEVFCGISSHELAEYFLNFNKERVPCQFRQKLDYIKASDDQIREQSKADVLASLHGYKQQILAYLEFSIECTKTYKDFTSGVLLKAPHDLIQEANERIELVRKYS